MSGVDAAANPNFQRARLLPVLGSTFAARVADRCGECPGDAIDILLDRPFSFSPPNTSSTYNPGAAEANRVSGLRLFDSPKTLYSVGTFVATWSWAPCDWTHEKCARAAENPRTGVFAKVARSSVQPPRAPFRIPKFHKGIQG
jgi:hypothetical protein